MENQMQKITLKGYCNNIHLRAEKAKELDGDWILAEVNIENPITLDELNGRFPKTQTTLQLLLETCRNVLEMLGRTEDFSYFIENDMGLVIFDQDMNGDWKEIVHDNPETKYVLQDIHTSNYWMGSPPEWFGPLGRAIVFTQPEKNTFEKPTDTVWVSLPLGF